MPKLFQLIWLLQVIKQYSDVHNGMTKNSRNTSWNVLEMNEHMREKEKLTRGRPMYLSASSSLAFIFHSLRLKRSCCWDIILISNLTILYYLMTIRFFDWILKSVCQCDIDKSSHQIAKEILSVEFFDTIKLSPIVISLIESEALEIHTCNWRYSV